MQPGDGYKDQGPSSLPLPCWGERRMPWYGAELPCTKQKDGVLKSRCGYRRTKGVDPKSPRPVCPKIHSSPFPFSGLYWAEWELTLKAISQAPSRGPGEGQRERSQDIYPPAPPPWLRLMSPSNQQVAAPSWLEVLLCPHFLWAPWCSGRLFSLACQRKGGSGFLLLLVYGSS